MDWRCKNKNAMKTTDSAPSNSPGILMRQNIYKSSMTDQSCGDGDEVQAQRQVLLGGGGGGCF